MNALGERLDKVGAIIHATDVFKVLASGFQKSVLGLLSDFFKSLQAIGDKTRTENVNAFDALFG
jgi:hypothetical protein